MMQHKVHWRHIVWNKISIPKTRFLCWFVARNELKTKDKLSQLGVVIDNVYPLCSLYPKSHNHLFFACPFSRFCVEEVKAWIGFPLKPITCMDFWKRCILKTKQHVFIAIYACTIYHIWKCRNDAVWHGYVYALRHVFLMIKRDIQQCCLTLNLMDAAGGLYS